MTTYQLVPYLMRVHVRGTASETRPLDNIVGTHEDLATELARLLAAHRGRLVRQPNVKQPKTLEVTSVKRGDRSLFLVAAAGRTGVVSRLLREADGSVVDREFDDTELIGLRHVLHYPPRGQRGLILAERAGKQGAMSSLAVFLRDSWGNRFPGPTLAIAPALSDDALREALERRPIKGIVLTRPQLALRPPRGVSWTLARLREGVRCWARMTAADVLTADRP